MAANSTPTTMKPLLRSFPLKGLASLLALGAVGLCSTRAQAATDYWNGGNGTWDSSTTSVWAGGTLPTSGDDIVFNTAGINGAATVTLSGIQSVNSVTINNTGATSFTTTTTSYVNYGAGGLTINSGAGAVTIGNYGLSASQTWTNASASAASWNGGMVANSAVTTPMTLTINGGTWNGGAGANVLMDNSTTGKTTLVVTGGASVSFQKVNGYSGGTYINSGSLSEKAAGAAGSGTIYLGDAANTGAAATLAVNINGTQTNNMVVQGTGLATIAPTGSGVTTTLSGTVTLNNNLTVASSGTLSSSPVLILSGAISGTGGFTLNSTSTNKTNLTLSGTNTYTGATTVNNGILLVNGSTTSATTVLATSASSAVLGGTGTIGGAVTVGAASGGSTGLSIIDAGTTGTVGTLAINGGLTFNSTSGKPELAFELNSTTATADKIVVTGNLVIGAGTLLSGTDLGTGSFAAGTVINLLSYTGTLTGTFNGYADGSSITVGSNTYTINYGTAVANEITLTFAAVPEPSTWALLGIGSALLAARFRKRLSATA